MCLKNGFIIHGHVPYPILEKRVDDIIRARIRPDVYISGADIDRGINIDLLRLVRDRCGSISFHGPFNDMTPGGLDEAFRRLTVERIHQTLDIAEEVRPEIVLFHAGYDRKRYDGRWDIWLEQSLKTWKGDVLGRIKGNHLTIALENVFEEAPFMIRELLKEIDHPSFRFCLDSAHATVFSSMSCYEWLEEMYPFIGEMHFHNTSRRDRDEHNRLSHGIIDFPRILRRIKELGIRPLITLEIHDEAGLLESMKEITRWLEES